MRCVVTLLMVACGTSSRPAPRPLTAEDYGRACVMAYACTGQPAAMGQCAAALEWADTLVSVLRPDVVHCLADATDCATAQSCVGIYVRSEICGPTEPVCSGNALESCSSGLRTLTTCSAAAGYTDDSICLDGSPFPPGCGRGRCSTPFTCDGSTVFECFEGRMVEAFDCAVMSGTCSLPAGGPVQACVNADKTAQACPGWSCDGTTLVTCDRLGHELRTDCPKVFGPGATCHPATVDLSGPQCEFAEECPYNDAGASCDGTSVVLCILGKRVTIDCVALGFSDCTSGCRALL